MLAESFVIRLLCLAGSENRLCRERSLISGGVRMLKPTLEVTAITADEVCLPVRGRPGSRVRRVHWVKQVRPVLRARLVQRAPRVKSDPPGLWGLRGQPE